MSKSKVDINCQGNESCGWATIEFPDKPSKAKGQYRSYLWFGAQGKFFGTIEDIRSLKKLRKMIDEVLETFQ